MVAFGILTPTSTTDVATKISITPLENFSCISCFSFGLSFPCNNPTVIVGNTSRDSRSYSCVAALMPNVSDSSINGQITFFQAEDGIRDGTVTGVQTCALPI